jgi:hypothetical protein
MYHDNYSTLNEVRLSPRISITRSTGLSFPSGKVKIIKIQLCLFSVTVEKVSIKLSSKYKKPKLQWGGFRILKPGFHVGKIKSHSDNRPLWYNYYNSNVNLRLWSWNNRNKYLTETQGNKKIFLWCSASQLCSL